MTVKKHFGAICEKIQSDSAHSNLCFFCQLLFLSKPLLQAFELNNISNLKFSANGSIKKCGKNGLIEVKSQISVFWNCSSYSSVCLYYGAPNLFGRIDSLTSDMSENG